MKFLHETLTMHDQAGIAYSVRIDYGREFAVIRHSEDELVLDLATNSETHEAFVNLHNVHFVDVILH